MRNQSFGIAQPARNRTRVQQHAAGRICARDLCATRLSVYNEEAFCSVHQHPTLRTVPRA